MIPIATVQLQLQLQLWFSGRLVNFWQLLILVFVTFFKGLTSSKYFQALYFEATSSRLLKRMEQNLEVDVDTLSLQLVIS